ncbi:MAG: 3'(2'),5'-bisphosphate nucleotidase CysQ, partial [Kofleriaceae bacterium]|nr:3'(2'),5'-bisphosphate nucleotidase CysQ [Kofleriaceae bacterium]
ILATELALARALAAEASVVVMGIRNGNLQIEYKPGDEPVTVADRQASDLIAAGLAAAFPNDIVISEENPDDLRRITAQRVWYIDPIDGTKDYIAGRDGFAVMIGLCLNGEPVLGVVAQASCQRTYVAAHGRGAWLEQPGRPDQALLVSTVTVAGDARLVASQSHRTQDIDRVKTELGIRDEKNIGSVGLKLALIAEGTRDLYVNPTPKAKLWDTCAPDAIIRIAGGQLTDLSGLPLNYRQPSIAHHRGMVGSNGLIHRETITRLAPLFGHLAPPLP